MRVALVIGRLRPGGAERQFRVLAEGLAERGHEVAVTTVFPGGRLWDEMTAAAFVPVTSLHARRAGSLPGRRLQLLAAPRRLRARLGGWDAVYSFLEVGNAVTGHAGGGPDAPPVVWGGRNAGGREGAAVRAARRLAARRSPRIPLMICNSEASRRAHASLGYRPARLEVVPNGIDTARFAIDRDRGAELRAAWGAGGPLVGVVGRLDPVKDHAGFLAAAARVAGARPDARFVCVGGGPLAAPLAALTRRHRLDDRVLWTGDRDDMPAVYNALDLVVLPSAWGESFPNVLGEAQACGVPVVATDLGDSAALVGDPDRVVPPGDPAALADAMARALDATAPSPEDLRARIADTYGVETMVARTADLLGQVVAARRT